MNDLQQGYDMVWEWRRANEHWFPTPPPVDCLAYAVTEIGEAIDADLRNRRAGDVRNNGNKDHSVEAELADCAFMLYSALLEWPNRQLPYVVSRGLPNIAFKVAVAYRVGKSGSAVTGALCMIRDELGDEQLLTLLRSRLERIEANRKPEGVL